MNFKSNVERNLATKTDVFDHLIQFKLSAISKVNVILGRNLLPIALNTYLPSILLIIISYATVFFKPFFFEATVTVNLTTLLVLVTLFVSVSYPLFLLKPQMGFHGRGAEKSISFMFFVDSLRNIFSLAAKICLHHAYFMKLQLRQIK